MVNAGFSDRLIINGVVAENPSRIPLAGALSSISTAANLRHEFTLSDGDKIVLATDGITDIKNSQGNSFGINRFNDVLARNSGLQPAQLVNAVMTEVDSFRGNANIPDDRLLTVFEFNKKGKEEKVQKPEPKQEVVAERATRVLEEGVPAVEVYTEEELEEMEMIGEGTFAEVFRLNINGVDRAVKVSK